jgi:hypothetical protein
MRLAYSVWLDLYAICGLPSGASYFGSFRLSCEEGLGDCTAEARRTRSKEFLIQKFSDLCELRASVVNTSPTENPE